MFVRPNGGIRRHLQTALWRRGGSGDPRWRALILRVLRTAAVIYRDAAEGELVLRAMSLVYTSLLSLVPLLALSFSILKAFGVHNQIRPMLQAFLAPLGENSEQITNRIVIFIENISVGVLGSLGLVLLLYTAVSLLYKVEASFNFIWHLPRSRSFGDRFSRYITLLLVWPILVFSALGITAAITSTDIVRTLLVIEPFGQLFVALGRLTPYLLVIAAFSFAYYFIPNTRVRPAAALLGGTLAGIVWQTAGWGFAEFAARSASYEAIYSGFAILILFMIWLYLSWLILLLGASVAFYCQHPEYLVARGGEPHLSNRMRERLGLAIMSLMAEHFLSGRLPLAADDLARRLGVPSHAIDTVLDGLEKRRLISKTADSLRAFLPARDLAAISVAEVLQAVRSVGEEHYLAPDALALPPRVDAVLARVDEAVAAALGELNLRDIADPNAEQEPSAGSVLGASHGRGYADDIEAQRRHR